LWCHLLDKSIMLKRYSGDEPRYWMLETIREYALERLEALSEADQLRRVHAEWFLVLAEKAEPHLRQNSSEWVDRLEQEHENIRAALDQLDAAGEHELALRFTGALSRFWYFHSHLAEGRRRLDAALRFAGHGETRAKALTGASMMAQKLGDTEASRLYAEKALALRRALGDAWGIAYGEMQIGITFGEEGDFASARPRLADSYRTFVELGDEHYASIAANNLGWVSGELSDKDRERKLYKENLARTRAFGSRQEGISLEGLASLERDAGRVGAGGGDVESSDRDLSRPGRSPRAGHGRRTHGEPAGSQRSRPRSATARELRGADASARCEDALVGCGEE
jgi:hypothetical protein